MKIYKIPVMHPLQSKIRYTLPISRKTIEIPESQRTRAIAFACISTLEAGAGLVFTLGGLATKEPVFTGIGLAVFGKIAACAAMVKGHLWDFAKKNIKITDSMVKSMKENIVNKKSV